MSTTTTFFDVFSREVQRGSFVLNGEVFTADDLHTNSAAAEARRAPSQPAAAVEALHTITYSDATTLYEVMKVREGRPHHARAHLLRLRGSLMGELSGSTTVSSTELNKEVEDSCDALLALASSSLERLIAAVQHGPEGREPFTQNIKVLVWRGKREEGGRSGASVGGESKVTTANANRSSGCNVLPEWTVAAYYQKSFYPPLSWYTTDGQASAVVMPHQRTDPNLKKLDVEWKERVGSMLDQTGAFEVLMLSSGGFLPEGSRSNVFFVYLEKEVNKTEGGSDGRYIIVTAGDSDVLCGITRGCFLDFLAGYSRIAVEARRVSLPPSDQQTETPSNEKPSVKECAVLVDDVELLSVQRIMSDDCIGVLMTGTSVGVLPLTTLLVPTGVLREVLGNSAVPSSAGQEEMVSLRKPGPVTDPGLLQLLADFAKFAEA